MAVHDFRAQRLYVEVDLGTGALVDCDRGQTNYLGNVLRMRSGDAILVFNGRHGEWRARMEVATRRECRLRVEEQVRSQQDGPDVDYLFAPLKRARLDYMVQKATELGVRRLQPVFTRRTQVDRINVERMQANVIEAAEQCGILRVPEVSPPDRLDRLMAGWSPERRIIFCDESLASGNPIAALAGLGPGPLAVLIGPEGGFEACERKMLAGLPCALPVSLGPRIMRADTAAVAALALVNSVLGDWR